MKIAIVCYPTFGGSGVIATELGMSLAKKGHIIHFISYKRPVRLDLDDENIFFHEVHVPKYPLFHYQPYELALSSMLVELVKLYQIDLLHVHYAIPHAYAASMAKHMLLEQGIKIPLVTTLHGSDITLVGSHPFYKPAVTYSINNSDIITTVSKSLQKDTFSFFNIHKEVRIIPNFINVSYYNSIKIDCKRNDYASDVEMIISHVSNFRPVKRVLDVIESFNKISKIIPSKLMMIGDGPDKTKAEKLAYEYGLLDNVKFLGKTQEVAEILCFSDLMILPSQTESFGLAALEAMISSTPVISTNSGGLPELNIHGKTGFLVEIGDIDAISKYSVKILSDKKALIKMKKEAYLHSIKYDINLVTPLYEKAYQRALDMFTS
ncbi:MAG: N-acetyl-alpha-D-glucosaminyl L-malate synthase BshA [Bacteroidota bacterium]|nr:N-acetyl-alpha-D-glucosaminyl L-malate synthase BshA [Bacteroidota bacterium]MEC8098437.1 N-acetyl-alpha-D-glucosaminyl L-malate synthase BshA [Bacteroidota bacterium]